MSSSLQLELWTFGTMAATIPLQTTSISTSIEVFQLLELPNEIIHNILPYLDFDTLKSVRSSCKSLTKLAGPLLFGTVRVRFRRDELQRLKSIAKNEDLRHFVHTLVYAADQFEDYQTFSRWKGALGISDPSPAPRDFRVTQSPAWTLEHEQWRRFRRHQQIFGEQAVSVDPFFKTQIIKATQSMHVEYYDHQVLLEALAQFDNLQNAYFLMKEQNWRYHGQTSAIRRELQVWKSGPSTHGSTGSTGVAPCGPRRVYFLRPIECLLALQVATTGAKLRTLVISGFQCGAGRFDRDVLIPKHNAQVFSGLRKLTLDFRINSGRSHDVADYELLPANVRAIVEVAQHLESFDLFLTGEQGNIGFDIFGDAEFGHPRLSCIYVSGLTFDEPALSAFVKSHAAKLQYLIILRPTFVHSGTWTSYLLGPAETPNLLALETTDVHHERALIQILPPRGTRYYRMKWAEDHIFSGGAGSYDRTDDHLFVEWPRST